MIPRTRRLDSRTEWSEATDSLFDSLFDDFLDYY